MYYGKKNYRVLLLIFHTLIACQSVQKDKNTNQQPTDDPPIKSHLCDFTIQDLPTSVDIEVLGYRQTNVDIMKNPDDDVLQTLQVKDGTIIYSMIIGPDSYYHRPSSTTEKFIIEKIAKIDSLSQSELNNAEGFESTKLEDFIKEYKSTSEHEVICYLTTSNQETIFVQKYKSKPWSFIGLGYHLEYGLIVKFNF